MKAIVYDKYGPPDVLRLEEIPKPIPGTKQVLVKLHAVSVNSWDWDWLTGKPVEYRFMSGLFKPKSNLLHGCDIAGRVEVVGEDVTGLKVGDKVFGDLAEDGWGAFAEYVIADEERLALKPESMTFEQAACLSHGGNLAVQGLIDYGKIKSGQQVLINGGGGSTGTLAIQIAKLFDTEVTAVDRTEKMEMMLALGADHVIDYTIEDFTATGRRYDLIFDVKTNRPTSHYKRALKPGGAYATVGGQTSRILQLLLTGLLSKKHQLNMVMYKANKDLEYLVDLFLAGKLKLTIDDRYPLEKTKEAFMYFGEGSFKGKIVVTMKRS